MADNFLENRMEQHRRDMAAGARPRHALSSRLSSHGAPRPGRLVVDFPPMNVLVVATALADPLLIDHVVATFRGVDAKVDLIAPQAAAKAAQRSGACFLGLTDGNFGALIENVMSRRAAGVDAIIALDSDAAALARDVAVASSATAVTVVPDAVDPWRTIARLADDDAVMQARLLALLSLPRQ